MIYKTKALAAGVDMLVNNNLTVSAVADAIVVGVKTLTDESAEGRIARVDPEVLITSNWKTSPAVGY
jgi:hypothetical protein